jgi:hypothetical protein
VREVQGFKLHQYEEILLDEGRLRYIVRPVQPQPEFRHNYELDEETGMLSVCTGHHGKSEGCRYDDWEASPFTMIEVESLEVRHANQFVAGDYLDFGITKWVPEGVDAKVCGSGPAYQYPGQKDFIGGWDARNSWLLMWNHIFGADPEDNGEYLWTPELLVWVAKVELP